MAHSREKIDARRMAQTTTMVTVRFCLPMRPLRKWVQVDNHPEGEGELPKEKPPCLVTDDGIRNVCNHTNQIDDQYSG
jgi:hypothetical protein